MASVNYCPKCSRQITQNIGKCPYCLISLRWEYMPKVDYGSTASAAIVAPSTPTPGAAPPSVQQGSVTGQSLWGSPLRRRRFLQTGLSVLAAAAWGFSKPSDSKPMVVGGEDATNIDNSQKILTLNLGPLIQCQIYIDNRTISYSQTYPTGEQQEIEYGMHLIDSMVQWKQGKDDELNQGPLKNIWNKAVIQQVQEKIQSAYAVICLGVADDLGQTREIEESLASRRAANLEKVVAQTRGSENRVHSVNLGQWLKGKCNDKGFDWDNQRRIVLITVSDGKGAVDYQSHVRDSVERLRAAQVDESRLNDNPKLKEIINDNKSLLDAYLNCYSRSADWRII
jgi:hypothetical protein